MMRLLISLLLAALTFAVQADKTSWEDYYSIKTIPIPKGIDPQLGGLTVLQDGQVAGAFHAGEIMLYEPKNKTWSQYAHGLHEPLGVVEEKPGSLVVMQTAELTRLLDENGDGQADYYQTLSDAFGLSGNYHEFAFGPAKDAQGNYYIALNVASNYAGIFEHIRGDFSPIGLPRNVMTDWQKPSWAEVDKFKAGRMFSKVNYRGWILKITPQGHTIPFASGFRSPDGLHMDQLNRLWVTDNQGDWKGTSPLYHVKQGEFYGHPASLVWKKNWQRNPVEMSAEELDQMRTPASALFPHGELANSPTQPISTIDPKHFGLPQGELLIGDMNQARLIRYLPEETRGFMQGALIPFLEHEELGIGNHRLSFDNSGTLWIGKTHLGWAGDEGIRAISWNRQPLLLVDRVSQLRSGFMIHFNAPVSDLLPEIEATSHTYHYHAEYGSEKVDLQKIDVLSTVLKKDKQTLIITLPKLKERRLYTLSLSGVEGQEGQPLMGDIVRYNLVKGLTSPAQ